MSPSEAFPIFATIMTLHYKTFGAGPSVLILHGLFGTSDNWQTIAKQLAGDFQVFLVDLRNHGRSPHAAEMDYPLMAADIRQFTEEHSIRQTHVVGHSMGGKVAMQFALDYPNLVDHLAIIDIAPKAYPPGHLAIFEALTAMRLGGLDSRKEADAMLASSIPQLAVRQFLLKNLHRDRDGFRWKMNLLVLYESYDHLIAAVGADEPFEGPSLFVRGGQSDYIQPTDEAGIRRLFPRATIETVARAGHWVHASAPSQLLALLRSFLLKQ